MIIITYLFRNSWKTFFFVTLASLISGFSGANLAKLISSGLVGGGKYTVSMPLFFGMCALYLVTKVYSELTVMRISQKTICTMRLDLCRKLLRTPLKTLQFLGKSELLVILTSDVPAFLSASQKLPLIFGNSIIILSSFVYMAILSWQMLLLVTIFVAIMLVSRSIAERKPKKNVFAIREQINNQYKNFSNLIAGSKELKLNSARGTMYIDNILEPDAHEFTRLSIETNTAYSWVGNIGLLLFYLFIGVILFVIPKWSVQPPEVLATFVLILLFMMRPINEMTMSIPIIRTASVALKKIQMLDGHLSAIELPPAGPVNVFKSDAPLLLELKDVCHQYPGLTEDTKFMLGPLNLQIAQGEILFIIGGNGSGKTTLAMLLLGLYEPESGSMVLNGIPVTKESISDYRHHFSAIFADFHLFEKLLGSEGRDDSASEYLEKFGIAHKVKVENGNFSTLNLSTGQRKRLALVCSYLEDRPVYLFDEWAADQDPVFKRIFYTELLPDLKARGKTVIAITHDDSYFSYADRIIKLEDGHLKDLAPTP
jgi:putative ATP-binding cassette transporter